MPSGSGVLAGQHFRVSTASDVWCPWLAGIVRLTDTERLAVGRWTDAASGTSTAQTPLRYDAQKQKQGHQLRLAASLFLASAPEVLWEEIKSTPAVERRAEAMVAADELLSGREPPGGSTIVGRHPWHAYGEIFVARLPDRYSYSWDRRSFGLCVSGRPLPWCRDLHPLHRCQSLRCRHDWYCLYRPVRRWIRLPCQRRRGDSGCGRQEEAAAAGCQRLDLRRRRCRSTRSPTRCSILAARERWASPAAVAPPAPARGPGTPVVAVKPPAKKPLIAACYGANRLDLRRRRGRFQRGLRRDVRYRCS